jgi:P4 family phage/plasmid primase-like protien
MSQEVQERSDELAHLHRELFGEERAVPPVEHIPLGLEDEQVLRIIRASKQAGKFAVLWAGDVAGYGGDDSAADMAMCSLLSFYCDSAQQVDRIFRNSKLMRAKWDSRRGDSTYGELTLQKAWVNQTNHYARSRKSPRAKSTNGGGARRDRSKGDRIEHEEVEHDHVDVDHDLAEGEHDQDDAILTSIKEDGLEHTIAQALLAEDEHFARDQGGKLYRFHDGSYRAHADTYIGSAVKRLLLAWHETQRWRPSLPESVCEYIRADSVELWVEPPEDEVCLLNGILKISERLLRPHSPEWLSPVQLPVAFDPDATCPANEEFMSAVYQKDSYEAGVPWEMEALYMLPRGSDQRADLFIGEGGTGKSTRLSRLRNFLGRRNVSALSLHRVENDRFAVAQLCGKLANIAPDLPSQHLETTSTFKGITGGDELPAEYKFRDSFAFKPFCHLAFSANHLPVAMDASEAFFDRWRVHVFSNKFRGTDSEVPQAHLLELLSTPTELSGVLNKALDAHLRICRQGGTTTSASMKEAREEFQAVTDPFAVWLIRQTIDDSHGVSTKERLRNAYNSFASQQGHPMQSDMAITMALKKHRPSVQRLQRTVDGKVQWCFVGIALSTESGSG